MRNMYHSLDIENLYAIWKDKQICPQVYSGGDSLLSVGEAVIFAYPDRISGTRDAVIVIPGSVPHKMGSSWYRGIDGQRDGTKEKECWIYESVPICDCYVYLLSPMTEILSEYADFCMDEKLIYGRIVEPLSSEFLGWCEGLRTINFWKKP